MARTRLSSAVFRLPIERIRDGYYSDAYFNFTKQLLEADGHHPQVLMQVFQKREQSILGGIDEAIAILRECSGRVEFLPAATAPTVAPSVCSTSLTPWL